MTRLWSSRNARNQVETYQVLFGFDKWDLNDSAQTTLGAIIKEMKENPNLTIDLAGIRGPGRFVPLQRRPEPAPRRGRSSLPRRTGYRAAAVNLIGLGPIAEKGTPNAEKRKVTVRMMVNKDE